MLELREKIIWPQLFLAEQRGARPSSPMELLSKESKPHREPPFRPLSCASEPSAITFKSSSIPTRPHNSRILGGIDVCGPEGLGTPKSALQFQQQRIGNQLATSARHLQASNHNFRGEPQLKKIMVRTYVSRFDHRTKRPPSLPGF